MYTFLLVLHCLIAVVLVICVLVQSGKGGGLGAGFGGGGANTLFGSSGGSNFFTKLTMCLAAGFMVTSLGLTMYKSRALKTSIFDQSGPAATAPAPAAPETPSAPPAAPAAPSEPTKKK
ncbi:MAG TPA: preprotein translocase subunit SecG [Bdellovibrionota bacterium]|jgi:preprotein translocase subunit SecG